MADLARLVVRLEADSLKFQKELDQAKRKLSNFEGSASKTAKQVGRVLGAAAVAAATGLAYMAKQSIDLADATSKAAQKIGVTTESLSQLRYAANLAGVAGASLDKSLQKLNRSMSEATITSTSKAAMAFKALGVEVKNADGSLRSSDDVLNDLADRMSGMRDGATKTALAMDIFGRSGADLIPLMNGGSKAIKEAREEADLFGQTIDGKAAKAAEQFNDNITRLGRVMSGAMLQAVQKLTPSLANLTDQMVANAKSTDAVNTAGLTLVTTVRSLISFAIGLKSAFQAATIIIEGFAKASNSTTTAGFALNALGPLGLLIKKFTGVGAAAGETRSASEIMAQAFSDAADQMDKDGGLINALLDDTARGAEAAAGATGDSAADIANALTGMGDAAKAAASEQASAMSTIQGMVQALQQQTATFEQGESAVIRYRIAQGDLAATFAAAGAGAAQYKDQLIALTDGLEAQRAASELAAAKQEVFSNDIAAFQAELSETTSPLKAYEQTIAFINGLLEKGALTQKQYNEEVSKAGDAFANAKPQADDWAKTVDSVFENAAQSMQSSLADFLFDPFADGLDGMLNGFVTMLRRMGAELLAAEAFKMLSSSFGGAAGGGTSGLLSGIAGLFGGARANGGPVSAGTPFLVGERGPELFVPGSSGNIMNTRETGSMGGTNVNMTVVTPDADSFRKSRRQVVNGVKIGFGV